MHFSLRGRSKRPISDDKEVVPCFNDKEVVPPNDKEVVAHSNDKLIVQQLPEKVTVVQHVEKEIVQHPPHSQLAEQTVEKEVVTHDEKEVVTAANKPDPPILKTYNITIRNRQTQAQTLNVRSGKDIAYTIDREVKEGLFHRPATWLKIFHEDSFQRAQFGTPVVAAARVTADPKAAPFIFCLGHPDAEGASWGTVDGDGDGSWDGRWSFLVDGRRFVVSAELRSCVVMDPNTGSLVSRCRMGTLAGMSGVTVVDYFEELERVWEVVGLVVMLGVDEGLRIGGK